LIGSQLQVVLPAIDTNRFFRLRSTSLPLPPFNTFIDFNLTMESAANPACGCGNEPTYGQGVSLVAGGCADCGESATVSGVGQDAGFGSVLLHNGELVHYVVDLDIAGRGFNWQFARKYRSGITFDGPLGRNWEFNYNRRLFVETNGHVLRLDGFARADRYLVQTNGSYVPPRGFYTKLIQNPNGSFTERDRHGTIVEYAPPSTNSVARMTELRDRNGNRMRFEYDGLSRLVRAFDTFDRQIDYRYDSSNRLTEVEDFIGRKLTYQYDSFGNLTSATSPVVTNTPNTNDFPLGKTTRYTYSSGFGDERLNHNLLTITAPNEAAGGPPRMRVEYETNAVSSHLDRITVLRLGGTNISNVPAGGMISYAYQILGAAGSNDFLTAVFQTTVTDRNGNLTEYQFNQLGNILRVREFSNRDVRPGDPVFFETRYEYNAEGEMTRMIYPETNSMVYAYDTANPDRFQQGNLLQITRLPDAARGGDQTNLLTAFRYEPLFNQVYTKTEPRGNDPAYTPPNGGANSPGRYTATNTFDYQESSTAPLEAATWRITIPPVRLGLGDVNGDGQTNQNKGNRIRRQLPTVNLLAGSNQALAEGDTQQGIVSRFTYNQFGQLTQVEDARGNIATHTYFPENDPDGDGLNLISGRNTVTGGYELQSVRDALIGPNRLDPPPAVAITNRFQRDRAGNITRHTDGRGLDYRYTYNALNQLVQEENPKVDASQATGYLTRYFYDANNNLVRRDLQNVTTDPTNHLPVIVASHPFFQQGKTYDMLDRVVEEARDATRDPAIAPSAQPELLTTRYRYDANGNLVQIISPLAVTGAESDNVERTLYDERDLVYQTTRGGFSAGASTYTYDYDRNGNRVRWTDAEDNDTTPGPETETTLYDGFDRRRAVIDRAGNEQRSTYDPTGRVVRAEFFGPSTASSTTNTLLRRTAHLFDELGRQFHVDRALFLATGVTQQVATTLLDGPLTPGDGNVSERYEYDALNRMTFKVEDDNAVYRNVFDGAGRRIRETLPLVDNVTPGGPYPTQTAFEYDANGNVVRRVDTHTNPDGLVAPANETHLYVYDALNRQVRATDALGQTQYTEFDSRNNPVATYDARGPLLADPLGLYTASDINDRGNVVRYAYDGLNRQWREEMEITTTGDGGTPRNLTNAFNADGLVVTVTEHDANSRIAVRYDDLTNRTVYVYDSLNRLVAQTNADGGFQLWQFDRDNNATSQRDENNTLHTFSHDGLGRFLAHVISADATKTNIAGLPLLVGTTLQTFQYDGLSRLVRCTDNNDPADTNDDWVVEAAYDSLNRLTEERQNGRAVSSDYVSDDRTALHYPGTPRVVHFGYDAHDQFIALSNDTKVAITVAPFGAKCPPPISYSFAPSNLAPTLIVSLQLNDNRLVTQVQQVSATAGFIGFEAFTRNRENDVVASSRQALNNPVNFGEGLTIGLDSLGRQTTFAASLNKPSGGTSSQRSVALDGAQDAREVRNQAGQLVQQSSPSPMHEPLDITTPSLAAAGETALPAPARACAPAIQTLCINGMA
jgi:YD repeat-containing protein